MKLLITLTFLTQLSHAFAQAIYDANGQYKGYSQTSPSDVTNIYNAQGQNIQSFQTDNGQTNFYSPHGQYQGSSTNQFKPLRIQQLIPHGKRLRFQVLKDGDG